MKIITIILHAIFIPFVLLGQAFPTDAKVLQDVKNYHGKIATAEVQYDWKLEREAGYNFSNMAKRVVAATTVTEGDISKKIIGLAIYTRGGAGEAWNFSRYFVTSSEVVGAKLLTTADLRQQAIDLLKTEPIKVFVNFKSIAWVYDISFPDIAQHRTDATGDIIYKGEIEYEQKFNDTEGITLPNYPFEAGLKRYKTPVEAYVRLVDGQMRVAVVSLGYSEPLSTKMMSKKQYESLPSMGERPFEQLLGAVCPYVTIADDKEIKAETPTHNNKPITNTNKTEAKPQAPDNKVDKNPKKIQLPKVKINIQ